ncbi:zinc transporter [Chlorella sorokiniana]|uniref:Zinc transporter n=1 Tax=Chlorella sorokiniana TaxID=3076 RepID=A0A2P6TL89_CHLSO|nr:zinc transporter [Chlorella sorokiniana]|eukprot:PRW45062.1 zinc transporter [Chlorella sorokiniana]
MVASGSVGVAWAMVLGAGAASSLGACVVFCVSIASPRVVASSLGFAAGVMLYVVFTEIFMKKSNGSFVETGYSVDAAYRLSTACFFGGIALTAALDAFVHAMMHWAARRRRRVAGRKTSKISSSSRSPDAANTPELVHSHASPAASEHGECGEDVCSDLPQLGGTVQPRHRCSSCTALLASRSAAGEAAESSSEGKDADIEMGSVAAASVDPLCAAGRPGPSCSPPRCCARRQPCCAGNPDCCGPTARCYNTGAGPAADEILPGTEAAEVVAVLQSDPHTQDLLRMGIFTGLAISLHNIPEGLATFVGALNDTKVGASIAAAIAIHNIPEGICVAMPIYYATGSKWKGFMWGSLTGFAEPLGGLIGYLAVHEQDPLSFAIVFGIVSGMMVYVSVKELLPSAFRFDPKDKVASTSVLVGMAVMAASLLLFTL